MASDKNLSFYPMGLSGLEPPTSRLSGVRSNRLSYKPFCRSSVAYFCCLFLLLISVSYLCFLFLFFNTSGSHLLSHAVSSIVPSAAGGLTIVFGMDWNLCSTGVSPRRIATRYLFPSSGNAPASVFRSFYKRLSPSTAKQHCNPYFFFLRKEVIQPHLPIRLPCYDFTPVIRPAFGSSSLAVRSLTSGIPDSHGVTGGVYKTRERIHRGILIRDY